ncbi:hypothetical protein [Pseudosporangium ferrugineum]|uniref:hypothetical protein n=1 Tax=Pseudosporangium ferrugineum TaxID=439699 RepID=UPI0011B227EB|nr:hypothetical protein [Pseudosporangium ferrugineum]
MRRTLIGLVVAAGLGTGAALVVQSPAAAYVYNCSAWTNGDGNVAYAHCSSGTGSYRVLTDCANVGRVTTVGGPWITRSSGDGDPPVVSSAGCGSGYATNPRVDSH